jgi:hypothetical protein
LTHEVILGHLGDPDTEETFKDPSSSTTDDDDLPLLLTINAGKNFTTTNSAVIGRRDADDAQKFDAIYRQGANLRTVCMLRWPKQVCELDSSSMILAPAYDAEKAVLGAFSFTNYALGARPYPSGTPNNVNYSATAETAGIALNRRFAFKVRAINRAGASSWSRA